MGNLTRGMGHGSSVHEEMDLQTSVKDWTGICITVEMVVSEAYLIPATVVSLYNFL